MSKEEQFGAFTLAEGATHVATCSNCRKAAFTLAEVLITLGVIGVVAAITMPVLIQNHRKHVVETRLKNFYSMINQAIALSENDNGSREDWDLRNSELTSYEWYNKYLDKYIKKLKIDYNESNGGTILFLTDGSAFTLTKYAITFYPEAKNYEKCIEDLSFCLGKTAFAFQYGPSQTRKNLKYLLHKGVEPYQFGWLDNDENTLRTDPDYGCNTVGNYCTVIIQRNGWKIPKDYPRKL